MSTDSNLIHTCLIAIIDSLQSAPPPVFDKKKVVIDRLYEAIKSAANADPSVAVGCHNTVDFIQVDDLGKPGNDDDDKVRLIPVCKYYHPKNKPDSDGDQVVLSLSNIEGQIHCTFEVDISLSKLRAEYVTVTLSGGEDSSPFSIVGEPLEICPPPTSHVCPKFYGLSRYALNQLGKGHRAEFEVQNWAAESHATFVNAIELVGDYLEKKLSDEKPLTIRFAAWMYQDGECDRTEAKLTEKYGLILSQDFLSKMKELDVEFYNA
jgi:hypothetical protein